MSSGRRNLYLLGTTETEKPPTKSMLQSLPKEARSTERRPPVAQSQQPEIKRTDLQQHDLSVNGVLMSQRVR